MLPESSVDPRRGIVGERGSLRRVLVSSLGVGALAFVVLAAPALLDRGHVVDDVLHNAAIPVAIGCALLLFGIGLAARGGFRRGEAGSPSPDRSWRVLGAMFAIGLALIVSWTWRDYRLAADLARHGVPVQASLVRQFDKSCGKTGCTIELEYGFVPKGASQPMRGFTRVGYGGRYPDPAYTYAVSTGTVPILYDPERPDRSMLYWSDQVARRGSARNALVFGAVMTVLLAVGMAPFVLGTWLTKRKRAATPASGR